MAASTPARLCFECGFGSGLSDRIVNDKTPQRSFDPFPAGRVFQLSGSTPRALRNGHHVSDSLCHRDRDQDRGRNPTLAQSGSLRRTGKLVKCLPFFLRQTATRRAVIGAVQPLSSIGGHGDTQSKFSKGLGHIACEAASTSSEITTSSDEAGIGSRRTETTAFMHTLASGKRLEVIRESPVRDDVERASTSSKNMALPPIIFVHGSFHAAWCFAEHWLPFFAGRGHDCYAISLLGQGGSDMPDGKVAGTIHVHAEMVAHFIRQHCRSAPILFGHSFGGLVVQSYLSNMETQDGDPNKAAAAAAPAPFLASQIENPGQEKFPKLMGAVLGCSVPPAGNRTLIRRLFIKDPIGSLKVTYDFIFRTFGKNLRACKEAFFSPSMPDEDVLRYQKFFDIGCKSPPLLNVRDVSAEVAIIQARPIPTLPILVFGAKDDKIVDDEAILETASYFGTKGTILPNTGHDVMLDVGWKDCAEFILDWVHNEICEQN